MKKNSYFKPRVLVISILFLQNLYTTETTFTTAITSILKSESEKKKADIEAAYNKYAADTSSTDFIEELSIIISNKFKGEINTENINLFLNLKELEVGSTKIMPGVLEKTLNNDNMQKMSLDDIFTELIEKKSFPTLLYCLTNSKRNPEYSPLATLSQILAKTDPTKAADDNFIDLTWDLMQTDLVAKNPALWKKMLLTSLDACTTKITPSKDDPSKDDLNKAALNKAALNKLLDKFEYVFKTSLSYNLSKESKTPFRMNGSVYSKYLMKKMTPQEINDYEENGLYQDNTEEDTKLKIPKSQSSFAEKLASFSMKKMSWLTSIFKYSRLALKIRGLSFNSNSTRYTKCMQLAEAFQDAQTKESEATDESTSEKRKISALESIATILTTVRTTPLVEGQPEKILQSLLAIDPTGELIKKHVIPQLESVNSEKKIIVRLSFIYKLNTLLSKQKGLEEQSETDSLPESTITHTFDPRSKTTVVTKEPAPTGSKPNTRSGTLKTSPSGTKQLSAAETENERKAKEAEAERLQKSKQHDHEAPAEPIETHRE